MRSKDEDAKLVDLYLAGTAFPEIAQTLGRRQSWARRRLTELRVAGWDIPTRYHYDNKCPRCRTRPRKPRFDGSGVRSWCGPCEVAQKADYQRTEAGRETVRRCRTKRERELADA